MSKKSKGKDFNITSDGLEVVTEKNNYISVLAVLAYKVFVAPRIPNAYLSNMSTVIIPALIAGFTTKSKELVEKMFVSGLAISAVQIIIDVLEELANKETDASKKAKIKSVVYALSGVELNNVSGIDDMDASVDGNMAVATYQRPGTFGYNQHAKDTHDSKY